MAGKEGSEKMGMSGWLMPCTGQRTPAAVEEDEMPASKLSMGGGRVRASHGRHGHAAKEKEEAVASAKRKLEVEKAAAAVVPSEDGKAAAASDDASGTNWVEMPEHHVRWILAQKREAHAVPPIEEYDPYLTREPTGFSQKNVDEKRELFASLRDSLLASHADFFEYQDWVRGVYQSKGRVMIPESLVGPKDEMQKEINDAWAQFKEEYAKDHADDSDVETEDDCAMDEISDSSTKEGLPCN